MSRQTVAFAIGAMLAASGSIAAPLAPIDSQQRGAAGWVATYFATSWTEGFTWAVTSDPVAFTQEVLARLNAVTTPAALRAMPAGLTLPCANGGSMAVRMSRGFPRVINVEWTACQLFRWLPTHVLTGPGQITLVDDNLHPATVAAITLGAAGRDLSMTLHDISPDESSEGVVTRSVRMVGAIPVSTDYMPEGSSMSAYLVTGAKHEVRDITFGTTGRAPQHYESHVELRNGFVWITNRWANDYFYTDDDSRYVTGEYKVTTLESYSGEQTTRWSVDNLRIRRVTDYANWSGNYSYDGGFTWNWSAGVGSGCTNGRFTLRTRSPFTIPSLDNSGLTDSGELAINNGAAVFNTYSAATAPVGMPAPTGTLLVMNVRNVGSFNYDTGLFPDPVRVASGCQ
jgi:hypothetical protein